MLHEVIKEDSKKWLEVKEWVRGWGVRKFSAREVILMAFLFRAWGIRILKIQFCTFLPQPLACHIMGIYLGCLYLS